MTKAIVEACRILGIAVHDHLIVGKSGHASLKALGLM
jgi:DNA repair protein RadC